jgi:glycosyltransferase involved in cell wall biosynthesis
MDLSFIVSAYDRPATLPVCLASLHVQVHKSIEVIVTDNSADPSIQRQHQAACAQFGARYLNVQAKSCYHSAEVGATQAQGEFLCFPSDDSYYVPIFAHRLLKEARVRHADLVYCEMLYGHVVPETPYYTFQVQPKLGSIDKTGFILRRSRFKRFPGKLDVGPCGADGMLIDELIHSCIRHYKIPEILVVHN